MDRTILTPSGIEINDSKKSIRIVFMYKGIRCRETLNPLPNKSNIKYCTNLRAEILNKIAKNEFSYYEYFPESKLAKRIGIIKDVKNNNCCDLLIQQLSNYEKMVKITICRHQLSLDIA